MANDVIRRCERVSYASGGTDAVRIANDNVAKLMALDVAVNLNTPGAQTPAATPLAEAPFSIIRQLFFDLDGAPRHQLSSSAGAIQWLWERWKRKLPDLPHDTVTAPAAGSSSTVRFRLPLNFGLPLAKTPYVGFLDFSEWVNTYLNMTMGTISNLFTTPNDTTVTSVDVDLFIKELLRIPKGGMKRIIEPQVQRIPITANNDNEKVKLNRNNRDYMAILLRAESATDTPSDAVISGKVELKGSIRGGGEFTRRSYPEANAFGRLQRENQEEMRNVALGIGYGIVDLVGDGNLAGAIGTNDLTDFYVNMGVTGAASNAIEVVSLVGTSL